MNTLITIGIGFLTGMGVGFIFLLLGKLVLKERDDADAGEKIAAGFILTIAVTAVLLVLYMIGSIAQWVIIQYLESC